MAHRRTTLLLLLALGAASGAAWSAPPSEYALAVPSIRAASAMSATQAAPTFDASRAVASPASRSENAGDLLIDRLLDDEDPRAATRPSTKIRPILHRHEVGVRLVIRF